MHLLTLTPITCDQFHLKSNCGSVFVLATRNHMLKAQATLAFSFQVYQIGLFSMQQASRLSLSQQNAIWPIREAISVPRTLPKLLIKAEIQGRMQRGHRSETNKRYYIESAAGFTLAHKILKFVT